VSPPFASAVNDWRRQPLFDLDTLLGADVLLMPDIHGARVRRSSSVDVTRWGEKKLPLTWCLSRLGS
jgi:hypothetical protein